MEKKETTLLLRAVLLLPAALLLLLLLHAAGEKKKKEIVPGLVGCEQTKKGKKGGGCSSAPLWVGGGKAAPRAPLCASWPKKT